MQIRSNAHERVKKICPQCKRTFLVKWNKRNQKNCSVSCSAKSNGWNNTRKADWSAIHKKSYLNGRKVAGGTAKWIRVKTSSGFIKVQGSYEVRACRILDSIKKLNDIKDWEYTNDRFEYIGLDNKKHQYLLDFKVINHDDSFYYIETKGYERENDQIKWSAVRKEGFTLFVWFNEDLKSLEQKYMST